MYDSGISVSNLVEELKSEVDIAFPISNANYVQWENALEQLLYTEFIQEQNEIVIEKPLVSPIDIARQEVPDDEAEVRFEDVYTIYADKTQLIKSTVASGKIFPDSFYKIGNHIGFHTETIPQKLRIIYFVKPALTMTDDKDRIGSGNVMVPFEFLDMVKAKLRGEAYKLANEDAIAAKWINDYNVLLESFKSWIAGKKPEFGM